MSVSIVDLGCGNIGSVRMAFERLGAEVEIISEPARVASAERLVLPGVGAAAFAMERMHEFGLVAAIREYTRPLLGICLGMQLLFERSEEGETDCLGLIGGKVSLLEALPGRRVPHMGWSQVEAERKGLGIVDGDYFWFAHSFACEEGPSCFARVNDFGSITAAVEQGNLLGCQFHPERSSRAGASFLKAFLAK